MVKTFSTESLAKHWVAAKQANGTRRHVVLALLAEMGLEDNKVNYRKVYNNVTQRVAQLAKGEPAIVFPELEAGKKGARRSGAAVANIQNILAGLSAQSETETKAPEAEGTVAAE